MVLPFRWLMMGRYLSDMARYYHSPWGCQANLARPHRTPTPRRHTMVPSRPYTLRYAPTTPHFLKIYSPHPLYFLPHLIPARFVTSPHLTFLSPKQKIFHKIFQNSVANLTTIYISPTPAIFRRILLGHRKLNEYAYPRHRGRYSSPSLST